MKKLNHITGIILGVLGGLAVGRILFICLDYLTDPKYYEFHSSPWYTPIIGQLIITAVIFAFVLICYLIIRRIIKHRQSNKQK